MTIELSRETRTTAIASIRRYFLEQLDQEVGDLKAGLMLDFFLEEIGGSVYNQAIDDAQTTLQDKVADLENSCFEPEFSYFRR